MEIHVEALLPLVAVRLLPVASATQAAANQHLSPSSVLPMPQAARQRLAFQELLALQLKLLVQRNMAWCAWGGGEGWLPASCCCD